jgi:hypothetical protein
MGDLHIAIHRAEAAEQAQRDINNFLAPFISQYGDFLKTEPLSRGWDYRDFEADTFVQTENNTFYLKGDETYEHGDHYTPELNLPFAFVEDPQQFKNDYRAKQAAFLAKQAEKTQAEKAERVKRLQTQLAKAQAELDKAQEDGTDIIKIVATSVQVANLRDQV